MNPQKRIVQLDYLRAFIILMVVAFHSSLSFMSKVPAWWYIKSHSTSIVFTIFVIVADVFMMPALFLISGYVLSIQLNKIDRPSLLVNRVKRLGIPWIACVLLFGPVLSLFAAKSLGFNLSYTDIITRFFWTDLYSQGPYWFLGILLTFSAIIIFLNRFGRIKNLFAKLPVFTIWLMLLIVPLLGYSTGSFFYGVDHWVNPLFIWSFQPSRICTYLVYFLAGYLLSEKEYRAKSHIGKLTVSVLLLMVVFVVLKGAFEGTTSFSKLFILGIVYSGLAFCMTALLIALFSKYFNRKISLFSFVADHSFVIYLLHLPVQVVVAGFIMKLPVTIYVQWAVLILSVVILSAGFSYLLMLMQPGRRERMVSVGEEIR